MKYSCDVLGVQCRVKELFGEIKLMCQLEEKAVINYNRMLSITQENFQVLTRTSLLSQDRTFREPWRISVPVRPLPSQKTGKPKVVPKLRVMKWGSWFWIASKCDLSDVREPHKNYGLQ